MLCCALSKSFGLTHSVQPNSLATWNLPGLMSTPMMREAFAFTAPITTASPTAPSPQTATVDPSSTFAVFKTAP